MVRLLILLLVSPLLAQDDAPGRIEALVRQLGSADEARHEAAARELLAIGRPARKALREAAKGGEAELRRRVNEIYPYVRWGVRGDFPEPLLDLLNRIESSDADGKSTLLDQIARNPAPEAREALLAAWWEVDDPALLARLAADPKLDPNQVERRLASLQPDGDPRVLRARAEARVRCGDDAAACELYARLDGPDLDTALLTAWGEALFRMRRHAEAAEVFSRIDPSSPPPHHAECLYRLDRQEEAEAVLARCLLGTREERLSRRLHEMALAYGSALLLVEGPCSVRTPVDVAARAWIRLGELDRAEETWRGMEDEDGRRDILELLLQARGEGDLLTPAFVAEALASQPEDAARHRRLATEIEKTDPAAALREWRKARFLDLSHGECSEAIERLGPSAPEAAGLWTSEAPGPQPHLQFGMSPIRLGDEWYYTNSLGDLVKTDDPLRPRPAWVYHTPRLPTAFDGPTTFGRWHGAPRLGRRGGRLLCLFDRHCQVRDSTGGPGWVGGFTLRVLDDVTGREEWSRDFPYYMAQGRLWPDAGVVTFLRNGLAVFDLDTRAWRWTVADPGFGGAAVWVHRDAVYLGFSSGHLCRLRADDGSLVWRKKWPGGIGGQPLLRAVEHRLLFRPAGQKLVALSLDDDSVLWEMQPRSLSDQQVVVGNGRAYLWSTSGGGLEAVSLESGESAWQARPCEWINTCLVSDGVLWLCGSGGFVCMDASDGRVLGACWDARASSSGPFHAPDGDTLVYSLARQQPPWYPVDAPGPSGFQVTRLVRCDAPVPPSLPKDEDVLAEVSLLEDACYGPSWRDADAWFALADACFRAGHPEWGIDAVRRGFLLDRAGRARLEEWIGRVVTAIGPEEEGKGRLLALVGDLRRQEATLDCEASLRAGTFPPNGDQSAPSPWAYSDLVLDPSPEVTVRRAVALARRSFGMAVPTMTRLVGDVPEPLAIEALDEILRLGAQAEDCSRLWPGSRLYGSPSYTGELEEALRPLCAGPEGALRGASLAVLELLGAAAPEGDHEASLRAAFASKEPRVRLAAAAALSRRGIAEGTTAVTEALRWDDAEARDFAVWLAGNLRMEVAVADLPRDPDKPGQLELEALAEIGTEAAWAKVVRASERLSPASTYPWPILLPLTRVRSDEAVRGIERLRATPSYSSLVAALYGMVWSNTPRARLAALEPARAYLRLDPVGDSSLFAMSQGLLELGDVAGAEGYLARLEAIERPTTSVLGLRMRVLAAKGDLDGAREARRLAEEAIDRAEAIHPGSARHKVARARLYLEPEAIADREKARALLLAAQAIAPREREVERLLGSR